MSRICGTCGKAISDGMTVYGARHIDKPFCSESCAEFADLNHEAETEKRKHLAQEFVRENERVKEDGDARNFSIVYANHLCKSCVHGNECAAQNKDCRAICHCKYFDREVV